MRFYLGSYEHNGRDDSDWYAAYWDVAARKVVWDCYDTTRCGGGESLSQWKATNAVLDGPIPPEEAARMARWIARRVRRGWRDMIEREEPRPGDEVVALRAVRARKSRPICRGDKAEVVWVGSSGFGPAYRGGYVRPQRRVGVRFHDGTKGFYDATAWRRVIDPWEWVRRLRALCAAPGAAAMVRPSNGIWCGF